MIMKIISRLLCACTFQTPSRCPAEPPVKQGTVDEGELSSIMTEAMVDTDSVEGASNDKVPISKIELSTF